MTTTNKQPRRNKKTQAEQLQKFKQQQNMTEEHTYPECSAANSVQGRFHEQATAYREHTLGDRSSQCRFRLQNTFHDLHVRPVGHLQVRDKLVTSISQCLAGWPHSAEQQLLRVVAKQPSNV
jgi:hypothetical protein